MWIADSAIVTGLGNSTGQNWARLMVGESAIQPITHFESLASGFNLASSIPDLWEKAYQSRTVELIRRVLGQLHEVPKETFIIWAGSKGDVEYIESSPGRHGMVLASDYRKWISGFLKIGGEGMEVNAACASSTVAVALGMEMISCGQCSSVLVCAADLVSRFVQTGFSALKALTAQACRPFDQNRDGLALGEGAVALLLVNDNTASTYGYPKKVAITGSGISNDANHITGPSRDGAGLAHAIQGAIRMSGLSPANVSAFCAHGTGTRYNDSMEMAAATKVFGDRLLPVFSIKGAIGHTLGAAGGIEIALCARAIEEKTVPPTSGLVEPELFAGGRVMARSQIFSGNTLLTSNSGFGGVNAALVLEI